MDAGERREEVGVVAAEVSVEPGVGVDADQGSDDLDGEHLRIGERRPRATSANRPVVSDEGVERVVDEAERPYDEVGEGHGRLAAWP